ncbi:MAG: MGMT family protein [Pyrinomonadaceae bacterium]
MRVDEKGYRDQVFELVKKIPRGKVMTYGQISAILGQGYTPRTVGYVMHGADEKKVPWQRVVNSQGKCSTGRITLPLDLQKQILESEGVIFSSTGKCALREYQWFPQGFRPDDDMQTSLFE